MTQPPESPQPPEQPTPSEQPQGTDNTGGGASAGSGGRGPVDTRGVLSPPPFPGAGFGPWAEPRRARFNLLNVVVQVVALGLLLFIVFAMGFVGGVGAIGAKMGLTTGPIEEYTYQGDESNTKQKIAIIPIDGFIDDQAAAFIHDCVEQVLGDDDVKAVVLRVNSGGGMVGPSEEMAHELERLKREAKLPIIASYGSIAASGAYYVSCGADEIYAQPTCVTGSIGVIAQVLTFGKLLNEKLGIKPEVLTATTSPKKGIANDVMRDWNQADRADVQHLLDAMHGRFIEVVKQGRGHVMSQEQLDAATQGQVFMAEEAVSAGLVDQVGHLSDAIEEARVKGKIVADDPLVVEYGWRPAGLVQTLLGSAGRRGGDVKATGLNLDATTMRRAMGELGSPLMLYVYRP